jgi:hypothetical protein
MQEHGTYYRLLRILDGKKGLGNSAGADSVPKQLQYTA